MTSATLWIGEICMAFGTIAFFAMSLRAREDDRHHYLVSIMIVAIATASYFAMAVGQSHVTLADGHGIFVARYIDWAFTTPLLLFGTVSIGVDSLASSKTALYGAIGADVFMIATGLAGALSADLSRYGWYVFSCIGFVAVLGLLFGPLRKNAAKAGREAPYMRLIIALTVLWLQYPVVWLLGDEGLRVLPTTGETIWFAALDVLAKVAFGFLSLATVSALASRPYESEGLRKPALADR